MPVDVMARLFGFHGRPNLRPRYNLPQYKAHNALSDALATAELFLAMADNLYPEKPIPLGEFLSKR